jgi:hypothetical protein
MGNEVTMKADTTKQSAIPDSINIRFRDFQFWQRFWFTIHYLAGVIAVGSGCLATAAGASAGPPFIRELAWMWGVFAAILSGVVTFLGPLQKAESYKHAYYRLSSAITRYQAGVASIEYLLDENEKAQNIVLLGDPTAVKEAAKSVPSS